MASELTTPPIQVERIADGAIWQVRLARPRANIIDETMTAALDRVFRDARSAADLKVVLLCAEGANFSFGASVQEHLPGRVEGMLRRFHGLFRSIATSRVPLLCAVRGHCLGGGLELAAFANRLFAAPDARLGQPEITLGVFAPVASLLLPERIGRGAAEDLCLSGRTIDANEALRIGLCDVVAEDPEAAALQYARETLCRHSASSLRHAQSAVRGSFLRFFLKQVEELERSYLGELMATHDAREGIAAFVDKRTPEWRNT